MDERGCVLSGFGCFLFFRLVGLTGGSQFGLLALFPACSALGRRDDINDYLAVVFAAGRTCAVRYALCTTFTLREALACDSVMAPAFTGLRAIDAHSYYHKGPIIQILRGHATVSRNLFDEYPRARIAG